MKNMKNIKVGSRWLVRYGVGKYTTKIISVFNSKVAWRSDDDKFLVTESLEEFLSTRREAMPLSEPVENVSLETIKELLKKHLTISTDRKYGSNDIKLTLKFDNESISETYIDVKECAEYRDY